MNVSYKCKRLSLNEYIEGFHEPETTLAACQNCNAYGRSWSCPPLCKKDTGVLTKYYNAVIIAMTVVADKDECIRNYSDLDTASIELRKNLALRLLNWENCFNGRSMSTIGKCHYCGDKPCNRINGVPCRHPELVRPSLEAMGFNLVRTSEDLLGIKLDWTPSRNGNLKLTYLFGFFY